MATKSKLAEINKEYQEKIKAAMDGELDALNSSLAKAIEIYMAIQEAATGIDVWTNDKLKDTLATLGLTKKEKKEGTAKGGTGKRLTGDKKQGLKAVIIKLLPAKGMKRGEIQNHVDVKTYCESAGVSTVPSLSAILSAMVNVDKTIKSEGTKSATVYKPK